MTRYAVFSLIAVVITASWCGSFAGAQPPEPRILYVAPEGNDSWSGQRAEPNAAKTDGPLRSLQGARDAIRRLRAEEDISRDLPVEVLIRGGDYFVEEPVVFTPEDSGTPDAPITFAAYPGEAPRLTGGLPISDWTRSEDGAWTAKLTDVAEGRWYFRQLFVAAVGEFDFERRYRPNRGPFVIAGLTDAPTFKTTMRHRQSQKEFRFSPGDLYPWRSVDDVEIVALHDWSASRLRIDEIDLEAFVVRFTGYPVYRIGHWYTDGKNPYFAENVREALGAAGQWYLDRAHGTLTYRPEAGEEIASLRVVAPRTETLIRLAGDLAADRPVEHLVFRGLTLSHTHWSLPEQGYSSGQGMVDLPAAVEVEAARGCRFERCTFSHLGAYALRLGSGCRDNTVEGNRMFDLGGGGVLVGVRGRGPSAAATTPAGNRVANNVISDGGLVHYSAHGIWVGIAAGTRVCHNVVRRFPYTGVSVGWSWNDRPTECGENVIEYNHIHDTMMLLADGGGIYTLGFQPGTVLRGNHIHDVHRSRFAGRAENNGIFFDQGSKGFLVEENVIHDTANRLIRYNQCQEDWHTFRDNSLGVVPGEIGFPQAAASRAGLQPEYQDLAPTPAVTPTPIQGMDFAQ